MRLTPLDIRKQEFKKAMRGLDHDEVHAFLATIADEYEAVINDNKALRERLLELDDKVQEYRNMEKTLRDTLLTAERVTVEAKENARREADLIVKEAQIEAEKAVRDVRSTAMRLRQEIQTLKQQKDAYLSRLKVLIDSHMKFIENAEKDFAEEERRFESEQREFESRKQPVEPAEPQSKGLRKILDEVIEHQKDVLRDEVPAAPARPVTNDPKSAEANREPHRAPSSLMAERTIDAMPFESSRAPERTFGMMPSGAVQAGERGAGVAPAGAAPASAENQGLGWSLERLKRDILTSTEPDEEGR